MPQEFSLGIIIVNGERFLLIRRFPGHWSFLKAKLEENDDRIELARKTIIEETGIKLQVLGEQINNEYKNRSPLWKQNGN